MGKNKTLTPAISSFATRGKREEEEALLEETRPLGRVCD
jgi:hypothetical protein